MKFIVEEKTQEYEFLLSPGVYIVGRDPTCDLTLDSKRVSRRHMSCTVSENEVTVRDLGSRNGVSIQGEKVQETTLSDGQELRLGDIRLKFRAPQMAPAGGSIDAEDTPVQAVEPDIEDAEETPPEGSLVHRDEVDSGTEVEQREDGWYVTDPDTGRELQIVPTEEKEEEKESLLATGKGKLIIATLAAVVILLFAAALFTSGDTGEADRQLSGAEFENRIGETLDALDRGDTEQARKLTDSLVRARPRSDTAQILDEITKLWDEWQDNFFDNWREMKRLLDALYRHRDSRRVESFVKEYRDWINRELRFSEIAEEARSAVDDEEYERAWETLQKIPRESVVREQEKELFDRIQDDLHKTLTKDLERAQNRQDWEQAQEVGNTIVKYFSDSGGKFEDKLEEYERYAEHAKTMEAARSALEDDQYERALQRLEDIPDDSPYSSEMERLRQRAKIGGELQRATELYNEGDAEAALDTLDKMDVQGADTLRRHIQEVMNMFEQARETQEADDLADAQELWEEILELETDRDNFYRRRAGRALEGMEEKRKNAARKLVQKAEQMYREEEYSKSRDLAEEAQDVDPDDEIGEEHLEKLKKQGRMDYRRALNLIDNDPEEAITLLERAIDLLSPDDKYYTWSVDEKRQLERELD